MTVISDHDMRVLPAVRRAVIGITLKNWGPNRCVFDDKVLMSAQDNAKIMTDREHREVAEATSQYTLSLNEILNKLDHRIGCRDELVARLILAMYFSVLPRQH